MKITTLIQNWQKEIEEYDSAENKLREKINQREKQIERLRKKKTMLKYPHWMEHVLTPLAEEICKELDNQYEFELFGPFGLGCETSIHFYKKGIDRNKAYSTKGAILSLTFRPNSDGLELKNYLDKDESFSSGSIGALNGFNYGSLEITKDMDAKWFINYMQETREA